jgi:hypothetical protein
VPNVKKDIVEALFKSGPNALGKNLKSNHDPVPQKPLPGTAAGIGSYYLQARKEGPEKGLSPAGAPRSTNNGPAKNFGFGGVSMQASGGAGRTFMTKGGKAE